MGAVAKGRVFGVFASTEKDGLGFSSFELEWGDAGTGVGAVAEGLIGALAAGAPEIGFAGFDGSRDGGFLRNDGF